VLDKRSNSSFNQARWDPEDPYAMEYSLAKDGYSARPVESHGEASSGQNAQRHELEESRRDSDGECYTMAAFIEYYGGSRSEPPDEWHAAAPMYAVGDGDQSGGDADNDVDDDGDDDEWELILPEAPSLAETGRSLFFRTVSGTVDEGAFPALPSL
jgi:hypothetical protein